MGSASPLRTSGYSKEIRILLERGKGTRSDYTVTYCGYTLYTHLKWVAPQPGTLLNGQHTPVQKINVMIQKIKIKEHLRSDLDLRMN